MNKEEFKYVKLGDLYVKEFKLATVMCDKGYWKVKREVSMTNDIKEAIPIEKIEAEGIMKLLDKSAVLIDFKDSDNKDE